MRVDGNIVEDIWKKQLIWYGHIKRMDEEHLPKQLLEWHAEGRRHRGSARTTWKEDIMMAVAERTLQEGEWFGRERWKTLGTGRHWRMLQTRWWWSPFLHTTFPFVSFYIPFYIHTFISFSSFNCISFPPFHISANI
jgi:hypothetical protein